MKPELAFDAADMLYRAGRREEAARVCWEILRLDPKCADAWAMRAWIESDAGRHENAVLHDGFALQAAPHRFDIWNDRGMHAMAAKMFKEAEESFRRSLTLHESMEGHLNLGNLLSATMRIDEAIAEYESGLKLEKAHHAQLHTNYGQNLIAKGRWKEGFQHYRSRFNAPTFPPRPRMNYPYWQGEPVEGKTILLFAEQGFGDEIQSLRFAYPFHKMGARPIIAVRPPMFRLAKSIPWAEVIMMYDDPPATPDYMVALLDVPAFVEIDAETVPLRNGYLKAENRGFRIKMKPGYNVGICWASGKRELQPHVAETAKQKSLSFDQLVRPLVRPGLNLYSLQQHHNDDAALRELGVIDPMPGVTDFADTAFFIDHLDLVITVDTSVAHLAGAMGKQVWNMVRHDAIWPWMQEKGPTCWYSSMHIYRQEKPFDWKEPLIRMRQDLKALLDRQAAA